MGDSGALVLGKLFGVEAPVLRLLSLLEGTSEGPSVAKARKGRERPPTGPVDVVGLEEAQAELEAGIADIARGQRRIASAGAVIKRMVDPTPVKKKPGRVFKIDRSSVDEVSVEVTRKRITRNGFD
jgi:hypothetical protein